MILAVIHLEVCNRTPVVVAFTVQSVATTAKFTMREATLCFAILLAVLSERGLCSSSLNEFYVKPTVSRAECPSPCHSLQDYADNSSFTTNNSKFIFLEGEHHLGTVVDVRNVANLSLVGNSSRVKILCVSLPSGFHIEEFVGLNIENMTIFNCSEKNSSIYLGTGSDVSFKCVNLSSNLSSDLRYKAVTTVNVVGTFVVSDSSFLAHSPEGNGYYGLYMLRNAPSNSPILIENNVFAATIFIVYTCGTNDCSQDSVEFTNNTFVNSSVVLANGGSVVMKDAVFSGLRSTFSFIGDPETTDATVLAATLENVSFDAAYVNIVSVAIWFANCTFENIGDKSAISASNSKLVFKGNNVFRNNTSFTVGTIMLIESSIISLELYTHILFENNHADYVGGAIYADHTASEQYCFFNASSGIDHRQVDFIGNTASYGGSSLYGGLQGCSEEDFDAVFNITNTEADPSAIASDPYAVCSCENNKHQPDCSRENLITVSVFPGQVLSLRLAVVGASGFQGVVRGAIHAFLASHEAKLGSYQESQISGKPSCDNYIYSIYGTENAIVTLNLAPEQNFVDILLGSGYFPIVVYLKECPAGFFFFDSSNTSGSCVCDPSFDRFKVSCDINDQSFVRPVNSWLGFINESSTELVVAFARNCPLGYCKPDVVNTTLNTSNGQCESNRTGLLCGKCDPEGGYSLNLGNGKCAKCSNTYLLLLFPLAVAGLLLVVVLFALNLTVTEGSINGLIFYANVLSMSNAVQFSESGSQYLYTFLAWLNLDLGIATCLYDGMDGYSETWLEFVFPAYLLLIIIAIILFYRQFPALAHRVCGENAVKVIATPLLLFYTKLQRTVVTIMSFTRLYTNDGVRYVWLYDANVEYFKGKHLYLGIAGIFVLVFFVLPYALCLTFFQQLQACSGHRLFHWVNRLKPVFDAYAGPYRDKYRFWTGMLLLVRTLLIILFTINYAASVEVNLLIISVVSCALLIAQSNGIYKKWPCNFLEAFFYGQLIVFSVGTVYARHSNIKNIMIVADTSIALTLLVFLAVLGYHVINRIHAFKRYCYHLKGYSDIEEDIPHSREIDGVN